MVDGYGDMLDIRSALDDLKYHLASCYRTGVKPRLTRAEYDKIMDWVEDIRVLIETVFTRDGGRDSK